MAQSICNICGANYEYKNGRWVCPACGAYKPEELSNEEVTLLYNASQKIRLALFDDAEEQYKDIVAKYPDNPDGYWGLVLAKYGIKYEQDYDGKMIPSCYAASYESVLSDKNYLKASELADAKNRNYYEEQASRIEKIRKEWIEKASKEEPYDIFISYKDTEKENGTERTKDSYDALELYTMLSKLGYRVFYSRESLKDKTGEKYEPYIFNALNTAHIMIVYGSKPEYIESTWIKNEWMRFYKRIKLGKKQPNALLVINNGFNPALLPSPLSKMQTLDRNRLDFSRELEGYCKRVIKAATTVLPKIDRVEVKAKQAKVGKIVKIEAVELKNNIAPKAEIVREEVKKREIGNYTVAKLTASAEGELKIAEMQLSTSNFDEAARAFNNFLAKNPKNGRALVGKLLSENKITDIDAFASEKLKVFSDWALLEQVLTFSEKSVSEKILKALCGIVLTAFDSGDFARSRDVYTQVSAYEDDNVTEMRKAVCDRAMTLIAPGDETAKYFIDGYLIYEQDESAFLSALKKAVKIALEKENYAFAKEYNDELLKYASDGYFTNFTALMIKYQTHSAGALFAEIERNEFYAELDTLLKKLNEESAKVFFDNVCTRIKNLLKRGGAEKQVYAYIDRFFRYNFDGRSEQIKEILTTFVCSPDSRVAGLFDLLLLLSDFDGETFYGYTVRFANNALKEGNFDLADRYYAKVNDLRETPEVWEGRLKCRLGVKTNSQYHSKIQNLFEGGSSFFAMANDLTSEKIIVNVLSLLENDDKRYEFLNRIIGYVYSALKTEGNDIKKCVSVFENLLAYIPKDYDNRLIEWLFKFARTLKNPYDEFDLSEKLYAIIVNYDAENHVAYWEMLQAKLHCKTEMDLIRQYNLITEFQEFQNALLASANNDSALRHYIDVQNQQKTWIEQDKERKAREKRCKKISATVGIIVASLIMVVSLFFAGFSYYRSESVLKIASDNGNSVYAGNFYKSDEILVIPQKYDGLTVTEIGAGAFKNHTEIKKVILPTTLTKIGADAFSGCVNLESVEFKNLSQSASAYAGAYMSAYAGAYPNAFASVYPGVYASESAGNLPISALSAEVVAFSASNPKDDVALSVIGARAFKGCAKLKAFDLNYGLKTIGEEAFSGSGLKEIAIPETVEYVGKNVFENCNSLKTIGIVERSSIPQNWDKNWNKDQEEKIEFSCRVVFDYNGADEIIKSEQYVVYDKTYSFPAPTKEGYTFIGWYFGGIKLTLYNGDALSVWNYQGGGTIKAEFTANENTIFFNGNGATSGKMAAQKLHTAESANLNSNGFVRNGYTFKGWATSANGTKVYNDGALYTMGKNSSYVLYAVWEANTNVLHFHAKGGSGTMSNLLIKTGSTTVLPASTFTRAGYSFTGWAISALGVKLYNDKDSYIMGTEAQYTLYAVWSPTKYSITYNLNGGSLVSNKTYYYITTPTFTLNNPMRDGYTFTGWSGTGISGQSKTVTIEKGSFGNREYVANWQANVNKVIFHANGGDGVMGEQEIETDSTVMLSKNLFTLTGYAFVGWATRDDGEMVYIDNATYTMGPNAEYHLYAIWLLGDYSISYVLNFGYATNPTTYNVHTETFTLNNPMRDGYTFTGWSGIGINGLSKNVTITKGSTGDRVYVANWEKNNTSNSVYTRVNSIGVEDDNGDYILFGEYPQTIKANNVNITTTTDSRGYYLGSDGAYYAKVIANKYNGTYLSDVSDYRFTNGNTITNGTAYYFKVEPIKWRILEESDGTVTLLCEMIIDAQKYDNSSNNYANSDIRAWLNDNFYNTAFNDLQKALLNTAEVDNSARSANPNNSSTYWNSGKNNYASSNTSDKVWLLSIQDVTNSSYGFNSSVDNWDEYRTKFTTDFARANSAFIETKTDYEGNCWWWLRSPSYNESNKVSDCGTVGNVVRSVLYVDTKVGVAPVIKITLTGAGYSEPETTTLYKRVNTNGIEDDGGDYILFGEYPQSEVTDSGLKTTLNTLAGTLPTNGNNNGWTSYEYYISGSNSTDFMWYKDISPTDGNKYRAVYFTSYRPNWTTDSSSTGNSNQDDNGYYISTVYWFKYEPIKWRVLTENGTTATILCEMIIDSQNYNYTYNSRTIDGKTVYGNNYEYSSIRAWLNDTFYNTAFTDLQKVLINTVTVDNSARSTNPDNNATAFNNGNNLYICANTSDKVWFLSEQEVTKAEYGFTTSFSTYDKIRRKKTTGYAKCQGASIYSGGSYDGNGYWWLRSPYYNAPDRAWGVAADGYTGDSNGINYTCRGIVPALTINLIYQSNKNQNATSTDCFNFNLLSNDTYEIVSVNNNLPADVIIPSEYNGKTITKIGDNAFDSRLYDICNEIKSVILPDTVLNIGSRAFSDCVSLEKVIIAQGVTVLKNDTFAGCSSLAMMVLPNSINSIERGVFFENYALKQVFYKGTDAEWQNISIGTYNTSLINATRYYYSENYPENFAENTYWHYVNGEPTVWAEISNNLYKRVNASGTADQNGNYILFGEYPQTIKANNVTITNTTDSRGYYLGSDGAYYAALTANPWENDYKYSNGNTVVAGNVYYFKVEPIKWRILTENNGTATLLCEMIIDINRFDDDSHDYASSEIRAWLINNFYNTAFNELQKNIINDNSFDNLNDKIYILSMDEVTNNAYGFSSNYSSYDTARKKAPTDYAIANRAFYNTDNYYGYGTWWTRTPSTSDSHSVWCVYFYGRLMYTGNQYTGCAYDRYGVVPALQITL